MTEAERLKKLDDLLVERYAAFARSMAEAMRQVEKDILTSKDEGGLGEWIKERK